MWKNLAEWGRQQVTIWRMRIACWIPKATDTDSEYVILIAFPLQPWLHERDSVLRYTYIDLCGHLQAESALNLYTGRPPTGVMMPDAV
jgi:hypothetical protein